MAEGRWYVVTARPGWTRRSCQRPGLFGLPDREVTMIEAALADAGFQNYLPRMKREIIHHRSKRLIVRTFPLFAGYLFAVAQGREELSRLFSVDGVTTVLGSGSMPVPLPPGLVEEIMNAEIDLQFDETREARLRRGEIGKSGRATTRLRFPVGSRIVTRAGTVIPGFHGMVTSVTGRRAIKAVLDGLEHMGEIELPVKGIERE